jgi:hypothetical protein
MVVVGARGALRGDRGGAAAAELVGLGAGIGRRGVVGGHHPAYEVCPQAHDLGHLVRHELQERVALGRFEVPELRVQLGGAFGERCGHLEEALRGDYGCFFKGHGGSSSLALDGGEPFAADAWIVIQVLHLNSPV